MKKIDLHVHTTCSDGNLEIKQILELAQKEEISTLSITDHETIINLENYQELEEKYNIQLIPGIEIPANLPRLHILGYGISKMNKLENEMLHLRKENEEYNKETIDILQKEGVDISYEEVKALAKENIITYRDIVKYLYVKGYVSDPRDAYKKYIGKGTKAYVPSRALGYEEVLNLIEDCNGISVVAHPATIQNIDLEDLLKNMKRNGLSGIEITPAKITEDQLNYYLYLAKKYNLIETTGSDFHNSKYDQLGINVEDSYMNEINKVLKKRGF